MSPYIKIHAFAPDWIKDFHCAGKNCPQTCCHGWNIPVDEVHALNYLGMSDAYFAPRFQPLLKKTRRKQNGTEQDHYFLNLLGQPGEICTLQNAEGLCDIHLKLGASKLCSTCYFFPKILWQIDEQWTLSTELSCPVVLQSAINRPEPVCFQSIPAEKDPQAEWLETIFILDNDCRALLLNRNTVVMEVIHFLQDRSMGIADRVNLACQYLGALKSENPPEDKSQTALWITEVAAATAHRNGLFQVEQFSSTKDAIDWVRLLSRFFNWGLQSAPKFNREAHNDFLKVLCANTDPAEMIAKNYLDIRNNTLQPFFIDHEYMMENFLVHFVFSDMLKQFSEYHSGFITVQEILDYEILQLCAIFALFQFLLVAQNIAAGKMDKDVFLQTVYHVGRSYIHFPASISQSITRIQEDPDQEEIVRLLLRC